MGTKERSRIGEVDKFEGTIKPGTLFAANSKAISSCGLSWGMAAPPGAGWGEWDFSLQSEGGGERANVGARGLGVGIVRRFRGRQTTSR
jgi:hypothetical protein